MEVEVTVSDTNNSVDENDINFSTFVASRIVEYPLTTTLKGQGVFADDDDNKDKMLDTYNEILEEYIKSEKALNKALESLEEIECELKERECELSVLKAALEEKKSSINNDKSDLINKYEIIQKDILICKKSSI